MRAGLEKGTYGYLDRNRVQAWKKAGALLAVPVLVFVAAWIIRGTRENVMTVVAIVGCLPGCNQIVRAILASRYSSMDRQLYEETEEARGTLPVLYENVFTAYEENYRIDCVAVSGREVVGYASDERVDAGRAAEHIRTMLKMSSYRQNVRIFREKKAFLERLKQLAETEPEPVPFQGDDRYPGWSRDEIIRHLLTAFSL